jgi:peroxiredoxin
MRSSMTPLVLALLVACEAKAAPPRSPTSVDSTPAAAPAAKPPAAMKPPDFKLAETPSDQLGTAPSGFGLKVGDKAPDATLPEISGSARSLAQLYAQRRTLVVFYRGGWCPFCNLQLHDYALAKPEFDKRGIQIVAISVDQPSEEAKTQAKHQVPFTMLSDSKLVAHRAYHVVHVPGDAERKAFASYHIDLAAYSGESHGDFAVPAIFLVDRDTTVRFVHVDEDYKTRPSAMQMLGVVDRTFGEK